MIKKFVQPLKILWATVFLTFILWILFGKNIVNSQLYQQNFNHEEWEQKQRESTTLNLKMNSILMRKCFIESRHKEELFPINTEIFILSGMTKQSAINLAKEELYPPGMCESLYK